MSQQEAYRFHNGKCIFQRNGVYFAVKEEDLAAFAESVREAVQAIGYPDPMDTMPVSLEGE